MEGSCSFFSPYGYDNDFFLDTGEGHPTKGMAFFLSAIHAIWHFLLLAWRLTSKIVAVIAHRMCTVKAVAHIRPEG